jgi:hypothetical protein
MSIGLLVDFLLHVLLRYYECPGTRYEKTVETLRTMGSSVLIGGITTCKFVVYGGASLMSFSFDSQHTVVLTTVPCDYDSPGHAAARLFDVGYFPYRLYRVLGPGRVGRDARSVVTAGDFEYHWTGISRGGVIIGNGGIGRRHPCADQKGGDGPADEVDVPLRRKHVLMTDQPFFLTTTIARRAPSTSHDHQQKKKQPRAATKF